ncbi:Tex family protein [Halanaerobaculum tunisiense]
MSLNIAQQLAARFDIEIGQVKATIKLLDAGNTIPFIARYRKEATGQLAEDTLRKLAKRLAYLRKLEDKKEQVIATIKEQGQLTADLKEEIIAATSLQQVKDLYRPFKPKRKTRANKAKEQGLAPVADLFLAQELEQGSVADICADYLAPDQGLAKLEDVLQGVRDIIAHRIADQPASRRLAREVAWQHGQLVVTNKVDQVTDYQTYYDFQESVSDLAPYQVLAINRGAKEDILQVKVVTLDQRIIAGLKDRFITNADSIFKSQLELAIKEGYKRLLAPAIAREIRSDLTAQAEEHAINVFARNVKNLLLQPPLESRRVVAIDPALRTGCKVAVVDETGKLLTTDVIYPHAPQKKWQAAKNSLEQLINKYQSEVIAIGNGTASRATEELVSELISELDSQVEYIIVNEAGASVYSASPLAKDEFPELDVSLRGAVSIGRRLQDPLAELVKIAPKHLGVGLYQHDLPQGKLEEALEETVESVVNYVGVNLNTASSALLEYVAGITSSVADKIVEYRAKQGQFSSREELKEVYGIGPQRFKQAAGFLRIKGGTNPLDQTPIHPESYQIANKLLAQIDCQVTDLKDLDLNSLADQLEVGQPTLVDIQQALLAPDRDPRDELPPPIFKEQILKLADLEPGMILQGKIRNVVDFGAFVDIGVKEDGLIHISELSSDYVTDPLEVVAVGEIVQVKVLDLDLEHNRISLTMVY